MTTVLVINDTISEEKDSSMEGRTHSSNWLFKSQILTGAYPYDIINNRSLIPEILKAKVNVLLIKYLYF
jgi:hypothetical protein